MKKLAIAFAVGAAALLGGSAANAADNTVKAKAAIDVSQQSTDFSSRGRHWRHHGHYRMHRHWRHAYYRPYARPYYGSYAYAPQPYYYGGGPVISLGFGGGGFGGGYGRGYGGGWGHHHRGW